MFYKIMERGASNHYIPAILMSHFTFVEPFHYEAEQH